MSETQDQVTPPKLPHADRLRSLAAMLSSSAGEFEMETLREAEIYILDLERRSAGNAPPLAEMLVEEVRDYGARTKALLDSAAGVTTITDADQAAAVTLLGRQVAEWIAKGDADRLARKRPFMDDEKTVDTVYNAFIDPLKAVKERLGGIALAWLRKLKTDAAAEQARQIEAARQAQIAANKQAALAAVSDDSGIAVVEAAIAVEKAAERVQQATQAPPVVVQGLGGTKVTGRGTQKVKIVNLLEAVTHLVATKPTATLEFVQKEYNALLRAKAENLPGAEVYTDDGVSFR